MLQSAFGTVILHSQSVILNQVVKNVLFYSTILKNYNLKMQKNFAFQFAGNGARFKTHS
jgi:hypothetical protein